MRTRFINALKCHKNKAQNRLMYLSFFYSTVVIKSKEISVSYTNAHTNLDVLTVIIRTSILSLPAAMLTCS